MLRGYKWLYLAILCGCGALPDGKKTKSEEATAASTPPTDTSTATATDTSTATATKTPSCQPGKAFVTKDMTDFSQVVELINAQTFPLSLDCFLQNLPRPYQVTGTRGRTSVQPAGTDDEPRMFIAYDTKLVISVTLGTEGRQLFELSLLNGLESLKGEIAFPLSAKIDPDLPYKHILRTDNIAGTRCAGCHGMERLVTGTTNQFTSKAFKPRASGLVSFFGLGELVKLCKTKPADDHCHRLEFIMKGDGITEFLFPDAIANMF